MNRTLHLAKDVHAVRVDEDLVLLDVVRDRYLCLPNEGRLAADADSPRALTFDDPELALEFEEAGLARDEAEGSEGAAPRPLPPRRSALRDQYPAPRWKDLADGSRAVADVVAGYHRRPFVEIVRSMSRPRSAAPALSADLLRLVDAFHAWAPYAPLSGKCLLRAFVLLRLLRRQGHDALWVFGVRTWPFHAHCWLQCEDVVLDDQPDRIRAFTPILVL
jgi:hypothetical protein